MPITDLPAGVVEALVTVFAEELAKLKGVNVSTYKASLITQIVDLSNQSIEVAVDREQSDLLSKKEIKTG